MHNIQLNILFSCVQVCHVESSLALIIISLSRYVASQIYKKNENSFHDFVDVSLKILSFL